MDRVLLPIRCGLLPYGFMRVRCEECGHDRVVALPARRGASAPRVPAGAWPTRRLNLVRYHGFWHPTLPTAHASYRARKNEPTAAKRPVAPMVMS